MFCKYFIPAAMGIFIPGMKSPKEFIPALKIVCPAYNFIPWHIIGQTPVFLFPAYKIRPHAKSLFYSWCKIFGSGRKMLTEHQLCLRFQICIVQFVVFLA